MIMTVMTVTRRSLARMLAAAARCPQTGACIKRPARRMPTSQLAPAIRCRRNAQQIAKVKLPMATEPAFQFKA